MFFFPLFLHALRTGTVVVVVVADINPPDTENIKLVFCAVKDTIMQSALKEFGMA